MPFNMEVGEIADKNPIFIFKKIQMSRVLLSSLCRHQVETFVYFFHISIKHTIILKDVKLIRNVNN